MTSVFGDWKLPFKILFRPINGFYEMKFEKKGTLKIAFLILVFMCISFAFFNQYTSIIVDRTHPQAVNALLDVGGLLLVLVLFCVANWAVTSLTDGEGKLLEIFMTICYAMTPLVLILIPATLFSNIITLQEAGFFHLLIGFAVFWFVMLVFIGLIVIHNYTVLKAIVTAICTFFSLLIILFLITLFFSLIQQLMVFINSIYRELSFRM